MNDIFQINFVDGSSTLYSTYSGFDFSTEDFQKESCSAKSLWYSILLLKDGENHKFKNYYAILPVNKRDPLFIKMFIEDNFAVAEYIGDTPEIPYDKIDRRFIQE